MKRVFQNVIFSCCALIIAGAVFVPAAHSYISECMDAKVAEGMEKSEAYALCKEEAKAEHEARMAALKAHIEEEIAMKKAFKECMETWEYDPETVTREEVSDQVDTCALDAGLITPEELAEIEAYKAEVAAKIAEVKAKIEEAKAEAEAKKAAMDACLEEAKANSTSEEIDMEAVKAVVDACMEEAGIDIEGKIQEIKDKIAEDKARHDAIEACIEEVVANEEMTTEEKKAEVEACFSSVEEI